METFPEDLFEMVKARIVGGDESNRRNNKIRLNYKSHYS